MKFILTVVLALSALLQLTLGLTMVVNPAVALSGFGLGFPGGQELNVICTFFGLTLATMGGFVLWAAIRIVRRDQGYDRFVTGYGAMLCVIGASGAILTGRLDALLIDFVRGALILTLQYFAQRPLPARAAAHKRG